MKKFIIIFLILSLINTLDLFAANDKESKNQNYLKKTLSVGLCDDKTGLSLIGVSVNTNFGEKKEIFVSGGTALILHSLSIGFIHYFRKSRFSASSLFSIKHQIPNSEYFGSDPIQYLSSGLTFEYNLFKNMNLKTGGVAVLDNAEGEYEFWAYPFLNVTFEFLD